MGRADGSLRLSVADGLAWREAGRGPAILFLHGIPDGGGAWDCVVTRLAADHRCLAPDLPGFGASAPGKALDGLADLRDVMATMVATLPLPERFTLAVHDVGGVYGLAWAVEQPERLDRLIILNTSIFPDRRWHWGARLLRVPLMGEAAMRFLSRRGFRLEMRRASNGKLTDTAIDATFDGFGPAARRTALTLYRRQTRGFFGGLANDVRTLTSRVPTRVIWGQSDPYLPAAFAHRFGAHDVRLQPGLGHWPHREAPDQVAGEIRSFLTASDLRAE